MRITDEQIVSALLATESNRKAAQKLGITERSLYRRLQSEELQLKLRDSQNALVKEAVAKMRKKLSAATDVFVRIMTDENAALQTRCYAADLLQKNFLKLSERSDILDRLDRLEREYR